MTVFPVSSIPVVLQIDKNSCLVIRAYMHSLIVIN